MNPLKMMFFSRFNSLVKLMRFSFSGPSPMIMHLIELYFLFDCFIILIDLIKILIFLWLISLPAKIISDFSLDGLILFNF